MMTIRASHVEPGFSGLAFGQGQAGKPWAPRRKSRSNGAGSSCYQGNCLEQRLWPSHFSGLLSSNAALTMPRLSSTGSKTGHADVQRWEMNCLRDSGGGNGLGPNFFHRSFKSSRRPASSAAYSLSSSPAGRGRSSFVPILDRRRASPRSTGPFSLSIHVGRPWHRFGRYVMGSVGKNGILRRAFRRPKDLHGNCHSS